jgi:hypothetical protein
VSYVFVAERFRRQGVGGKLLTATRAYLEAEAERCGRAPLRGVFAEIQRAGAVDRRVSETLKFWARHEVMPLAVDWKYPPLHEGDTPVPTYLAFGSYERAPVAWYPPDLELVATAIFSATYSYLSGAPSALASIISGLQRFPQGQPVPFLDAV